VKTGYLIFIFDKEGRIINVLSTEGKIRSIPRHVKQGLPDGFVMVTIHKYVMPKVERYLSHYSKAIRKAICSYRV
jgi:hypothetical protein